MSYSLIDDFIHHRYVSVQLDLSRTIDYQIPECIGTYAERTKGGRSEFTVHRTNRNHTHARTHARAHSLVVVVIVQILLEPIHVLEQVFHAVHQTAVRAEFQLVHDVVHGYQIPHVERHLVTEVFGGGIEVRDVDATPVLRSHREAVLFRRRLLSFRC